MIRPIASILVCASLLGLASAAHAQMSPEEVARLGKDLTPNGAEMAGNAEGTIPPYTGGLTEPPAGWKPEMGYVDPFKNEQPLFKIDAKNAAQYEDKLSPGMVEMLKKFPNQFLPVYKTHRTFANPPHVYEETRKKAATARVEGLSIHGYDVPGTPFPVPRTGVEAMYNQTTKYFGGYKACRDWLPTRGSGSYYRVGFCEHMVQGQNFEPRGTNHVYSFYGAYDAPATLIGTIYLVQDPIDLTEASRQAWIYNAGQRRVRRAPDLGYDNIDDGTEGMRTTDDYWGFQGAMDRFEWKLLGKKEMYIPYNGYKQMDPALKYADMVVPGGINPEFTRWELHRVWVVEATLREGMSHVYARRTFYLDEDSHTVALADGYDGRGNLWRVFTYPLVQAYDAGVMFQVNWVHLDLTNGNYIVTAAVNERPQPVFEWNVKGLANDFTTDAVRRRGVR